MTINVHRRQTATAAVAVLLIAGAALAASTVRVGDHHRQVVVTVTATPADSAATQIVTADGAAITPVRGQPTELTAAPTRVSAIAWAGDRGASCTVWIDGVVVVEQTAAAEGQPVSCMWPE